MFNLQHGGKLLRNPICHVIANEEFDEESHLLFCVGNLSLEAYSNFFKAHKCSAYCGILGLSPETVQDDDQSFQTV